MNKEDCLIELPNLKISQDDVDKLLKMADELAEYWIEVPREDKNFDYRIHTGGAWLKYPGILEHPLVKEWIGKLPAGLKITNGSVMRHPPWFVLAPHQDIRDAVFMIMLTPNPAPIYFLDSQPDNLSKGNLILEHTYTCPTIINAHVTHGVNNSSDFDRIAFQIAITQPWEEIVQIIKSSGLA